MALLQDKTQETLIHTAYTYTPLKCTDTLEAVTHSHTLSAFSKSARKFILCFWCPSLFRDLLSLSVEPLMLLSFPEILRFLRTQPFTKYRKQTNHETG